MVKHAANHPRGVANQSSGKSSRRQALEDELIKGVGAHQDEIGANNGSIHVTHGGGSDKKTRMKKASFLKLKQGKRQRKSTDLLNWYAASAYRPKKVKSFWQDALDAEHDRYDLPDAYKEYEENPTTNQYGLVDTALKNYTASRSRLSSQISVGV